jgi:hypothetical protein
MYIGDLTGKTVILVRGAHPYSSSVEFFFSDLTRMTLDHAQSCCETVLVEEVIGDVRDLIGRPLLLSEEVVSDDPEDFQTTATWYKFVTNSGSVTIRWLGRSNGYYSQAVDVNITTFKLDTLTKAEQGEWDRVMETI